MMTQLKQSSGAKSGINEQLGLSSGSNDQAVSETEAMVAFSQANLNQVNIMKLPDAPTHEIAKLDDMQTTWALSEH